MVKWYIIGYFVIGIIVDIIARIYDEITDDEFQYEPMEQSYYIFIFLGWPLAILVTILVTIHILVQLLSKYIAKKIKERSKHEQTKD